MAKTIMISNEVYEKLKSLKGEESFSEVILQLTERKEKKTVGSLLKSCSGLLKGDKEYDKVMKDLRKGWEKWNKRYA